MSTPLRVEMLERQAERQRDLLENHVAELRQSVKEQLDIKRHVSEHAWPIAGLAAILGLSLGFTLSGIFTRD